MIKTFGKFMVEKGESDNPRDLEIAMVGFDMEGTEDPRLQVLEILDYIKEQLQ